MMKKRIEVVGAVLVRDGLILAAQRSETMSLPLTWEFPGGKIESGETAKEALARELREELLCEAEIGQLVTTTEHEYDFGIVVLTTFYATLKDSEPKLTEHSDIKWLPTSELSSLNWAPADVPAVEKISRELG